MAMRLRSFVFSTSYRYGYQGSEKESEVAGMYTTDFRMLDVRIGRWFMPDPIFDPGVSPYSSMDNNPIALNDVLGLSTGGGGGTKCDLGGSCPSFGGSEAANDAGTSGIRNIGFDPQSFAGMASSVQFPSANPSMKEITYFADNGEGKSAKPIKNNKIIPDDKLKRANNKAPKNSRSSHFNEPAKQRMSSTGAKFDSGRMKNKKDNFTIGNVGVDDIIDGMNAHPNITFQGDQGSLDKSSISDEDIQGLNQLVSALQQTPGSTLLITGNVEFNASITYKSSVLLGLARADALKTYLTTVLKANPEQISIQASTDTGSRTLTIQFTAP